MSRNEFLFSVHVHGVWKNNERGKYNHAIAMGKQITGGRCFANDEKTQHSHVNVGEQEEGNVCIVEAVASGDRGVAARGGRSGACVLIFQRKININFCTQI